jgi:hypothetical protein
MVTFLRCRAALDRFALSFGRAADVGEVGKVA